MHHFLKETDFTPEQAQQVFLMPLVLVILEAVGLHKLAVPFDIFGGKNLRQTERKLEGRKLSNSDHQVTYTAHVRGRRAYGRWAALTLEKLVCSYIFSFWPR